MKDFTKFILQIAGFYDETKRVELGFCPICAEPVSNDEFRDALSKKEYEISGMCQKCQDKVFKGE